MVLKLSLWALSIDTSLDFLGALNGSFQQLIRDFNPVCKSYNGSTLLVYDPKPAREPDVKAVDISHDEHVLIAQETRVLALGGMLV